MAPLKKVFIFYLLLSLFLCILLCSNTQAQSISNDYKISRRLLLDTEIEDPPIITKKKPTSITTKKNQTKLIKPLSNSTKNQTKLIKSVTESAKNQTKLIKSKSDLAKNQTKSIKFTSDLANYSNKNKTKLIKPTKETLTSVKAQLKKFNSTSKPLNSTKPNSNLTKKPSDLTKFSPPKSKPTKTEPKSKDPEKPKSTKTQNWLDQEDEEDDLVSNFRALPSKFQQTLLPDLEKISLNSKIYLTRYNKQITKGFKPYVGTKYAPTIASIVSFAFIIIPLILVSLLFNRIKAYLSLQKLIIFAQLYLSIYFSILCLSSLVTGLEPLRFFYATSQSTYICLQILQTLGYVLYLLLLLMYLVLIFSTETGPGSKVLGLAQTFVGFAIGLHCYVTVFHRVVLRQPPKTNWKVHGIYATCFLVICLLANADRRKKAYLEEGGEEGKKS